MAAAEGGAQKLGQAEVVLAEVGITFEEPEDVEPELQLPNQDSQVVTKTSLRMQKLVTMKHLEVEGDIIRGIKLQKTLRSIGSVWMKSARELSTAQGVQRWEQSINVASFDVFLSHTWMTNGRWKVLSLLLQTNWHILLLGWVLGVLAAIPLHMAETVPAAVTYRCERFDYEGICGLSLYAHVLSMVGILMGLAIAPYVPRFSDKTCFLDIVSIHQADKDRMERGIYAIGGFLSISAKLQILWDRPYFRRLWCVFELAAYRTCNPSGTISLSPLFIEAGLACCFVGLYAHTWVTAFLRILGLPPMLVTLFVLRCFVLLPFTHYFRRSLHEKHQMIQDLQNFDLDNVQCESDFDKEFIYAGIRAWYGSLSGFTSYVRGPLADELFEPFSTLRVPRAYWLLLAAPLASWHGCWVLAMIRADAPSSAVWWEFMRRASFVLLNVICLKLTIVTSDYFAKPSRLNWVKTFCIWICLSTAYWVIWQLYYVLEAQGESSALASSVALLIFSIFFIGDVRTCPSASCRKAIVLEKT